MRVIPALVAAAAVAAACSSSNSDSTNGPSSAPGTLNLMIKDSPYSDAKALLVTFSEVTAHRSDGPGGQETLPFADAATSRTCDLKKLVDAQDVLGTGPMEAGRYTMVRLVVSSAKLYFDNPSTGEACAPTIPAPDGLSADVEIGSGEVKLNRPFEVSATAATTMLVDFDGDKSVHETGNGKYRMTPVISVVSVQ